MKHFLTLLFSAFLVLSPAFVYAQTADDQDLQELERLQDELKELRGELQANAQPDVYSEEIKVRVMNIAERYEQNGFEQIRFEVEHEGQTLTVDTGDSFTEGLRYRIREGSSVYLQVIYENNEVNAVFLVDVVRTQALTFLFLLFCVLVIAIGYWRGVHAIVGLGLTILILFGFIIPQVLAGRDPVFITVIGSVLILAVNMHLSHGFHRQTFLAFLATLAGLSLSVIFATFFVWIANLSGLSSEETALLYFQSEFVQLPKGILLAGIILGAVGVLDDIAITQSETVSEIVDANPGLDGKELYRRAMRVGRHHIASTVNTLVLAYAGVAFPLFLLFVMIKDVSPLRFINEELVAEEIVRTLAGTSALILTVPIASLFAIFAVKWSRSAGHIHKH